MIKYKVIKRTRPSDKKVKYHCAALSPNFLNQQKLVDRISARCTVTSADVKAVLDALEYEMVQSFQQGDGVRLGDVGTFRPSLRSNGADEEKDVTEQLIKSVHIVYTPSLRLKRFMDVKNGTLSFQKATVVPLGKKKKPGSAPAPSAPHEGSAEHGTGESHLEGRRPSNARGH